MKRGKSKDAERHPRDKEEERRQRGRRSDINRAFPSPNPTKPEAGEERARPEDTSRKGA